MGAKADDPAAEDDEKPQHAVYLDSFYIDTTEVTNAMFQVFVDETAYNTLAEQENWGYVYNTQTPGWEMLTGANWRQPQGLGSDLTGRAEHPVVQVALLDARAYCAWRGGDLPSEAQWEKAARGTDGRIFPWGNDFFGDRVNFCDQSCSRVWRNKNWNDGYETTSPVSEFSSAASPYGLLGMAGNVWEWVLDQYLATYYANSPYKNPTGPDAQQNGVVRGGAWDWESSGVRVTERRDYYLNNRADVLGFRCAAPVK